MSSAYRIRTAPPDPAAADALALEPHDAQDHGWSDHEGKWDMIKHVYKERLYPDGIYQQRLQGVVQWVASALAFVACGVSVALSVPVVNEFVTSK